MATRERKTRNITESPNTTTDLSNVTTTQKTTTPTKGVRGRIRGRGSGRPIINNDDNESVQSNEDETVGKPQRSSSRMSSSSVVKEEMDDTNKQEDVKNEKTSPGRTVSRRNKVEAPIETFTKRIVRSNSDLIKRSPLVKRKSLPVVSARGMGRKRGTGRRSLGIKPVKSVVVEDKDESQKGKTGRRRKTADTLSHKKDENVEVFKKPAEIETNESEITSQPDITTVRRRRSASKSSDIAPTEIIDADMKNDEEADTEKIKTENVDIEDKQEILEKMAQNFSETKILPEDTNTTRRSSRPRKSTFKDKEDVTKQTEIKKELKNTSETLHENSGDTEKKPLEVNTDLNKEIPNNEVEKDSSLSPQLISEGISEISVKTFYGEPDFLENNLGIEKDPKLGEIVQVKNKITSDVLETHDITSLQKPTDCSAVTESEKASVAPDMMPTNFNDATDDNFIDLNLKSTEVAVDIKSTQKTLDFIEESGQQVKPDIVVEENKENNMEKKDDVETDLESVNQTLKSLNTVSDRNSESPETIKEKEKHLLSLGLLTHEAAVEAAKEKRKRREILQRNISKTDKRIKGSEYTGTLKTIIKLNRTSPEKRKTRTPLKITFAKGKHPKQNVEKDTNGLTESVENTFYTIHQEKQTDQQQEGQNSDKSRKAYNRFQSDNTLVIENVDTTKEPEKRLIVPEKASSFKVHPDRLCLDQCFYCGGKFGLYDTPCHIAQIKQVERQDKILQSEEKLTRDSCLCDACFRHVDKKANCPLYRKRLSAIALQAHERESNRDELEEPQNDSYEQSIDKDSDGKVSESKCCVINCNENAMHTLRKKWLIKTKKQVSKFIDVDEEIVNNMINYVPICDPHYQIINHLMICAMCKRKLPKNHIYFIAQEISRLEYLIYNQGIPIKLGKNALIVCKLCRYYANLLLKPSDDRPQTTDTFIKNYSKRLLQLVNVETGDKLNDEEEKSESIKQTTKLREMRKVKKSCNTEQKNVFYPNEPEISIIPSKQQSSNATAGHILLDNDVMVDYDNPLIDNAISNNQKSPNMLVQKQVFVPKERDMTKALKSNPNISMRELFPGEEEMNLHINIPFNSTAVRTPEGWARVNTSIQYDEATRNLWEELQKPYGNQSSFLKHLILLEKYFRNGDLVLSQNASTNAVTYSESVQNRLKSYDTSIRSESQHSNSSISILQQLSNAPITITPTVKNKLKIGNADNLVKNQSNNAAVENAKRKLGALEKFGHKNKQNSPNQPPSKHLKIDDQQKASLPPDLISINTNQSQKPTNSLTTASSPQKKSPNTTQQVIKLPDTLTPTERKQTAKPWRPTLIPITSGSSATLNSGPLYQTADGRKLPGLVQVMSGGKPYHISIHDYNRMCILRREKLWQIQKQQQQQQQHQQESSTNQTSGGQKSQNPTSPTLETNKSKPMVQIPNQLLEQNSLIPISSSGNTVKSINLSAPETNGTKQRKSGNSLLKTPVPIAPKLPNSTSVLKIPVTATSSDNNKHKATVPKDLASNLAPPPLLHPSPAFTCVGTSSNLNTTTTTSAIEALMKSQYQNQFWLWGEGLNNANMLANSGGSIIVDNSLLSKIPKSLTVIPQQKNRNLGDSSNVSEEHNPSNG